MNFFNHCAKRGVEIGLSFGIIIFLSFQDVDKYPKSE